jgi:predicted ATPase/class 3 adenylate cyclase
VSGLPSGVVTFFFSDIEGSTRLWENAPASMEVALARHHVLLRASIEREGGAVFKTMGDEICAAFSSPMAALSAAESVQRAFLVERWPEDAPIKVRIGLHTGWCEERDGDYVGATVNMTARLEAAAHGGQIVCSQATAELLAPGPQATLVDLGDHELAGIDTPVRVIQVSSEGLPSEFPPLRTPRLTLRTSNLPTERSTFVGRGTDVDALLRLVAEHRLVTLTGPGGVGKSRLALEVGRRVAGDVRDGVWLVELATASDDVATVASAVLAQLGIAERSGKDDLDVLVETLLDQDRLILLDNCEHVISACARLCDRIAAECIGIRLLATSREPLRVEGEQLYRVAPLSLPPEDVDDAAALAGSEAVALFVERASAQNTAFRLLDRDAAAVASICRRLDGVPLALELATARLGADSLEQLDRRLDQQFRVLTRGRTSALPHQQTLRALIDWSFEELDDDERTLFMRLSVFRGGFDVGAASATCALDDLDPDDVADLIEVLVDKSLVDADVRRDPVRYTLLESLRQYGTERVENATSTGGGSTSRRLAAAHARYFSTFYDQIHQNLSGPDAHEWVRRGREEQENLRYACEELVGGPDATSRSAATAVQLLGSVASYADSLRDYRAIRGLIDGALERAGIDAGATRAAALYCKARVIMHRDDHELAECLEAAVEASKACGDTATEICATAFLAARQSDVTLAERATSMARVLDEPRILAIALNRQGVTLVSGRDGERGRVVLCESLSLSERHGDVELETLTRLVLAATDLADGNLAAAREHLEQMGRLFLKVPPPVSLTCAYVTNLGWLELEEGEHEGAARRFRDALRRARLTGTSRVIPDAILGLARCATLRGDVERAAVLHGAADAASVALSKPWDPAEARFRDVDRRVVMAALGDEFPRLVGTLEGRALGAIVDAVLDP